MGQYFRKKKEDIVAPFLMLAKEPIIPVTDRPVKVCPFELLFPFVLFYYLLFTFFFFFFVGLCVVLINFSDKYRFFTGLSS
jgi:hypothetical protein